MRIEKGFKIIYEFLSPNISNQPTTKTGKSNSEQSNSIICIAFQTIKKNYLNTGRRRPETSWTQRSGSSATESALLPLLVRSSDVPSSGKEPPKGRVWLIWAWWRARARRAPAAYLCVGVKNDVVAIALEVDPEQGRWKHAFKINSVDMINSSREILFFSFGGIRN